MRNKRDDFTDKVKRLLRERAGNQCSHPECRAVTTAAGEGADKVNNIGKAAHICAAAPGGPRYKAEMTPEERRSIENGIWLCSNHADEIDNDEQRFSESLLRQWKQDAEEARKYELGKPLLKQSDVASAVAAALTGTAREFVPAAIHNTHKAVADVLSKVDPRFEIETGHQNGITSFVFHAKEDVQFAMNVAAEHAREFAGKYRRLVTHGDDVVVDLAAVSFHGSDLFDEMRSAMSGGNLSILSRRTEAITGLRLVSKDKGVEKILPDAVGVVRYGTEALTFEGALFGGMIEISYAAPLANQGEKGQASIVTQFSSWSGRSITRLPYLDRIFEFLNALDSGWILEGNLEVEGRRLFDLELDQVAACKDGSTDYLRYLQSAACIAGFLGVDIKFDIDYVPTIDEFKHVVEAARIARAEFFLEEDDIAGPIVSPLVVDDDAANVQLLQDERVVPSVFKFIEAEGQSFTCMGERLHMPPRETTFLNIVPKIDVAEGIKPGDVINVEWVPASGFKMISVYRTGATSSAN